MISFRQNLQNWNFLFWCGQSFSLADLWSHGILLGVVFWDCFVILFFLFSIFLNFLILSCLREPLFLTRSGRILLLDNTKLPHLCWRRLRKWECQFLMLQDQWHTWLFHLLLNLVLKEHCVGSFFQYLADTLVHQDGIAHFFLIFRVIQLAESLSIIIGVVMHWIEVLEVFYVDEVIGQADLLILVRIIKCALVSVVRQYPFI